MLKHGKLEVYVLDRDEYLKNPTEIGLDKDWSEKSKNFGRTMKAQGVYILHVSNPIRIIYVGKTRGPTMDFATRLYRHCVECASGYYPKIYQALKKTEQETGGPILASLLTIEQIRDLVNGMKLEDPAIVDVYEQILIHLLRPEVQE